MKIMQINCVYEEGSTGKITQDIHHYLISRGVESLVYYGRGEKTEEPGVWKVCSEGYGKFQNLLSRLTGVMYGGCFLSTLYITARLRREKPDVVHLQCINGYFVNIYRLISWLKRWEIPTVLTLHAEFMYTANCGYALDCEKWKTGCGHCPRLQQETCSLFLDGTADSHRRMKQAFRDFGRNLTVVSVSPWLKDRAKASPILGEMEHRVILNGLDTDIFTYQPSEKNKGEKIIFHATAFFTDDPAHIKGGFMVLELAKRLQDLPVRFLVAGDYQLRGAVPENVTLLGKIRDRKILARQYCRGDITLLTSKKETFSMVCAESLCCGTPVVGFEAGAPEMVALPQWSEFVPAGDLDALEQAVRRWLFKSVDKTKISREAARQYSLEAMAAQYLQIYRGMQYEDPA